MDELFFVFAIAGVITAYFLAQVAARRFDPFAPVWLFLVGYVQVYVIQALSYHDWAVDVRGKELVTAANFRAFWAVGWFLAVYHLAIGRRIALAYIAIWMFNGKRSHSLIGVLATVCAYYITRLRRPSWPVLVATSFTGALVVTIAIGWRNNADYEFSMAGFTQYLSEFKP